MSVLNADDVSVWIGEHRILAGVDLEVDAGELLALVGPNGAGKSTLLGALAGDIQPGGGTVTLDDRDLTDWGVGDLSRRRAVLLQEQRLSFSFTCAEVVAMGRSPWRGRPEEDEDDLVVAESMHLTEVTQFATRHFSTLSGGEKARTSFARILAQRSGLLLLDEPTAALDIAHQEHILTLARQAAARGEAVVVVLHDLTLAAAYCDRICLLADGEVRAVGPADEVVTAELLTDVYGHPIDVFSHPDSDTLVVLPRRGTAPLPHHQQT